jgi:ATP-dependent DNA ligase
VGSLLLGLFNAEGHLQHVGVAASFTMKRRAELVEELEPLVARDEEGKAVRGETDRSRFSANKDVSFVPLRPERVVEVAFDQLEGMRFRHAVTFLRWRPDRDPESCTLDQVDRAVAYDLADVLQR